ncbi:hypothetical protein JTB14_004480 [Gonioctena quinquepunctata]|nr:hypothetical protein JTB14_004480 [Gonioctena quinquepunctata]
MATRGKKILLLAQQENEEIENHPLFLPPYETTKGTSSVQQQKCIEKTNEICPSHESMETFDASVQQQKPKIHPVGYFDNFPESLGENNEDSITPVLLTNNPLSIEFSELS